jgi:hypothetical protein
MEAKKPKAGWGGARKGSGRKPEPMFQKSRAANNRVLLNVFEQKDIITFIKRQWRKLLDPKNEVDPRVVARLLQIHAEYTQAKPTQSIEIIQDATPQIDHVKAAKAALIASAAEEASAGAVETSP